MWIIFEHWIYIEHDWVFLSKNRVGNGGISCMRAWEERTRVYKWAAPCVGQIKYSQGVHREKHQRGESIERGSFGGFLLRRNCPGCMDRDCHKIMPQNGWIRKHRNPFSHSPLYITMLMFSPLNNCSCFLTLIYIILWATLCINNTNMLMFPKAEWLNRAFFSYVYYYSQWMFFLLHAVKKTIFSFYKDMVAQHSGKDSRGTATGMES